MINSQKEANKILGTNNIIWRPGVLPEAPSLASLLPYSLFPPPSPLCTLDIRLMDPTACTVWHSCSKAFNGSLFPLHETSSAWLSGTSLVWLGLNTVVSHCDLDHFYPFNRVVLLTQLRQYRTGHGGEDEIWSQKTQIWVPAPPLDLSEPSSTWVKWGW